MFGNANRWKQRIKNKIDNNWYEVSMTLSYWTHIHPSSANCHLFLIRHQSHTNNFVLFKRAGHGYVMNINEKHFLNDSAKIRNRTDLNSPGWLERCSQSLIDLWVACIWQIKHLTTSWPDFSTVFLIIDHKYSFSTAPWGWNYPLLNSVTQLSQLVTGHPSLFC